MKAGMENQGESERSPSPAQPTLSQESEKGPSQWRIVEKWTLLIKVHRISLQKLVDWSVKNVAWYGHVTF